MEGEEGWGSRQNGVALSFVVLGVLDRRVLDVPVATIFRHQYIVSKIPSHDDTTGRPSSRGGGSSSGRGNIVLVMVMVTVTTMMMVKVINEFVFTFAGCGSRRHGPSVCGCLLGRFGSTWSGCLGRRRRCCRRRVLLCAQRLSRGGPLRPAGRRRALAVAALQSLLHLPDPGLGGLQLVRLRRDLLFPVREKRAEECRRQSMSSSLLVSLIGKEKQGIGREDDQPVGWLAGWLAGWWFWDGENVPLVHLLV